MRVEQSRGGRLGRGARGGRGPLSAAGRLAGLALTAAGALALFAGGSAQAQVSTVLIAQPGEENKPISILVGQSQIVRPPWPVARVSVTDPAIADVEALTPEQVL